MQILNEIRLTDEEVETLNEACAIMSRISTVVDRNEITIFKYMINRATYDEGYKFNNTIDMYELNNY